MFFEGIIRASMGSITVML